MAEGWVTKVALGLFTPLGLMLRVPTTVMFAAILIVRVKVVLVAVGMISRLPLTPMAPEPKV